MLEAAVEQAEAEIAAARVWSNPSVELSREQVFAGGRGEAENFITLELPIEISGRRGLRVESAELGKKAAEASAARDRAGLLLDAAGLYWRAAAARESVHVLSDERGALGRVVEAERSRAAAGDTSSYDLDRLELELDAIDDALAEAETEHEAARRALGFLAGEPDGRFDAADSLALPAPPVPIEGLAREALESRADLRALRLRVAESARELDAADRGWIPDLVLSGGAKSAPVDDVTAWGYVASLSLTVPVFDRGQGDAAKARARKRQAEAELASLEQKVKAELVAAHETLTRTLAQAGRFESTQLPRQDRVLRRAELAYREGERPAFELVDAYRTARGVHQRYIELQQKARVAEIDLLRALGREPPRGVK